MPDAGLDSSLADAIREAEEVLIEKEKHVGAGDCSESLQKIHERFSATEESEAMMNAMMRQILCREVLEEPLKLLAAKYEKLKSSLGMSQLHSQQYSKLSQILRLFSLPTYNDETSGEELQALVTELQSLGDPPSSFLELSDLE